jgi:23S rRNA pseudouridine955/2504/2580 synthase
LVIARNRTGAVRMFQWLKERESLKKCYWAIVVGKPAPSVGRIKMRLVEEKEKMNPIYDQHSKDGKASQTEYKTLDNSQLVSLLELFPITGRKHQLRVKFDFILTFPGALQIRLEL